MSHNDHRLEQPIKEIAEIPLHLYAPEEMRGAVRAVLNGEYAPDRCFLQIKKGTACGVPVWPNLSDDAR